MCTFEFLLGFSMNTFILLTTMAYFGIVSSRSNPGSQEVCQWESFNATCGNNQLIMITSATYGRMNLGRCVQRAFGVMGCSADVTKYADSFCSGRRQCLLKVADFAPMGIRPCSQELSSYMEASYTCVEAKTQKQSDCRHHRHIRVDATKPGYIARNEATPTGNTYNCPWRLQALPGQKLNITLYDFSVFNGTYNQAGLNGGSRLSVCKRYARITENPGQRESPICGGLERVKSVYLSDSHQVDIKLIDFSRQSRDQSDAPYFFMGYNAIGCPHVKPPKNSHVIYSDNSKSMTVTCNTTKERWYLTCRDNQWVGTIANCSDVADGGLWNVLVDEWASPYGILVIVGLGVMLGVALGVILLLCAVFVIKRHTGFCACMPLDNREMKGEMTSYCTTPCDVTGKLGHDGDYLTRANWLSQRPLPNPDHNADRIGLTTNSTDDGFVEERGDYSTNPKPFMRYHGGAPGLEGYPMEVACNHAGVPQLYESPQLDQRTNIVFVDT